MTYRLARPIHVVVRSMPERWAGRVHVPAGFCACIVANGPRSMRDDGVSGKTRDAAVKALIELLQAAGYTGTLRVENGVDSRPPWD